MSQTQLLRSVRLIGSLLAGFGLMLTFQAPGRAPESKHDGHGVAQKSAANRSPASAMHLNLCAFHVAKERPGFQVEAHHSCAPAGADLHQRVRCDPGGFNPRLLGIEYIITDEPYPQLPAP